LKSSVYKDNYRLLRAVLWLVTHTPKFPNRTASNFLTLER